MRRNNFHSRIAVQGSLKDKVRESDRRLQRIADYVAQATVSLKPFLAFREAHGMNKNNDSQFLGFGPKRVEGWGGQLFSIHGRADNKSPKPILLDTLIHLLNRKIGVL